LEYGLHDLSYAVEAHYQFFLCLKGKIELLGQVLRRSCHDKESIAQ
jgi:hypothetical protein